MENTNPIGKLISTSIKLEREKNGKPVDEKTYRGMTGSLLYLTISRLDFMFAICLCAHFQSSPRKSHLITLKCVLRYLKGTLNLWYAKGTSFELVGYFDAKLCQMQS